MLNTKAGNANYFGPYQVLNYALRYNCLCHVQKSLRHLILPLK